MIFAIVVSMCAGFIIARAELIQQLLCKFGYEPTVPEPEVITKEVIKEVPVEVVKEVLVHDETYTPELKVVVFPKQKTKKSGMYWAEPKKSFKCSGVTYKNGVLAIVKDDLIYEDEISIKDIDEFMIY